MMKEKSLFYFLFTYHWYLFELYGKYDENNTNQIMIATFF